MGESTAASNMNCKTILVACLAVLVSSAKGDSGIGSGSSGFGGSGGFSGSNGFGGSGGFTGAAFGSGRAGGPDTIVVTQTRTIDHIETRISTVAVVQPAVEEVTDVWRNYVLNTRYAEQVVDVLHEVQNVDFVTVTRTVQEEIVVTEQVVQTQVVTDYNQVTDYRYVTHYEYVPAYGGYGY